ncbi:MAG: hypothetical protein GY823_06010 [Flavobacteriaceae bacterium]|nr:hypothetical protein [Flavobacteriaceae bacterium]
MGKIKKVKSKDKNNDNTLLGLAAITGTAVLGGAIYFATRDNDSESADEDTGKKENSRIINNKVIDYLPSANTLPFPILPDEATPVNNPSPLELSSVNLSSKNAYGQAMNSDGLMANSSFFTFLIWCKILRTKSNSFTIASRYNESSLGVIKKKIWKLSYNPDQSITAELYKDENNYLTIKSKPFSVPANGQWVLLGLHYNMFEKPEKRVEISENNNNTPSPFPSSSEPSYFKSKFSVKFDISSNGKYLPRTENGKGKINLGSKIKDYDGLPLIINGYLDDHTVRDLGDIVVSNMMIYHDYLDARLINNLYNTGDPIQVNKNLKCYWKIKSSKFLSTYPMVEDSVSYNDMIFYYTDRDVLIQDVPNKAQ